jgi:hypothetical protein
MTKFDEILNKGQGLVVLATFCGLSRCVLWRAVAVDDSSYTFRGLDHENV